MDILIPAQTVSGQFQLHHIPGDKSISHRAIMIGSLAENTSIFSHFLFAEDCLNTVKIFQQLGVPIRLDYGSQSVRIDGVGLHGLQAPHHILDVGNSGTSIRLLTGILAAQPFTSTITGDASIQQRPMRRVIQPLTEMGATLFGQTLPDKPDLYPPLHIHGNPHLKAIRYTLPVASAQVKSALLFAALFTQDRTEIIEPEKCRDHTERMLKGFGADIHTNDTTVFCSGKHPLHNPHLQPLFIPADFSSAAFFLVLGCLLPNLQIDLHGIGLNPTRSSLLTILQNMGALIHINEPGGLDFEPYATLQVSSSTLENLHVPESVIPFLIDELPILAIAGQFGSGTLKVTGAQELRTKESDRINGIADLVHRMGGTIRTYPDGFEIDPNPSFQDFDVNSHGDHRIAMSAIIGAIASKRSAVVRDCDCINTSFPNFFECLKQLGVGFSVQ